MNLRCHRSRLLLPLLVACVIPIVGCAIKLQHDPLDPPANPRSGPLAYQQVARGPSGSVGWGRGTVFAIPMVPIFIQGDDHYGGEILMEQMSDALRVSGYEPIAVEPGAPSEGPYLQCQFEASYNNYTWVFPIVPTWGWLKVEAQLVGRNGEVLWEDEFNGNGWTLNFFNGYTSSARQSLNELLAEAVMELTSDEFHVALATAEPQPIAEEARTAPASVSAGEREEAVLAPSDAMPSVIPDSETSP